MHSNLNKIAAIVLTIYLIYSDSALFGVLAWDRIGDTPLLEPMMTQFITVIQGWFLVCAQPMRDGVTL